MPERRGERKRNRAGENDKGKESERKREGRWVKERKKERQTGKKRGIMRGMHRDAKKTRKKKHLRFNIDKKYLSK